MGVDHLSKEEFKENKMARYLGPKCKLSRREGTDLFLISGRDKDTFTKWFLPKGYNMIVEHGVWISRKGEEFKLLENVKNDWMEKIRPVLVSFVDRTPGSFIEEKNYWFEGDESETILDIRFIICSNQPIIEYLKTQTIHEELFYRINVISISIPSITERSDDLLTLFNQCLLWYSDEKSFSPAAKEKLLKHDFHFNYRELENIIEKAVAMSTSDIIEKSDIILSAESIPTQSFCNELPNSRGELALDEYIERIEIQEIEKALEKTRWNRTEAAKLLGISFRTMRYKMKKLSIE